MPINYVGHTDSSSHGHYMVVVFVDFPGKGVTSLS